MKRFDLILVISLAAAPAFADGVVKPNRTLPKFTPPKTTLEFSANPTAEEISRSHAFEEPLMPIGGEPSADENAALAGALLGYAHRSGPDDFASLTDFLDKYPKSSWRAALLTGLGSEYYNTAHYSLALDAWSQALKQKNKPTSVEGMVVLARAVDELALLYARLGRMTELEALLRLAEAPGASERIKRAREALWLMQHQPEMSFRCGPMALKSILKSDQKLLASCGTNALMEIFNSASTQKGFSLTQVAELSRKIGLNYQTAYRSSDGTRSNASVPLVVPSVVHWKVGHYAALMQQVGDRYLLEDPTFGNSVWATRQALETETSGYFLIPPGDLPPGWRSVEDKEGASIWGKGVTGGNDDDICGPDDLQTGGSCPVGMPAASIHLMTANLSIVDTPLAYTPPVGPSVRFTFRYNSRDSYTTDRTFGGTYWNGFDNVTIYDSVNDMPNRGFFISPFTRMTHDWTSYLIDSPQSPLANVKYVIGGGGARTFTGFDTNTQSFAAQQYDQSLLRRTSPTSYEMILPDGSKRTFSQPNGSVGSGRRVYLTQIADPAGNALTFTYDQDYKVIAVTDAIDQVTSVYYGDGTNAPTVTVTRVTDPFGRSAIFEYEKRSVTFRQGILRIISGNTISFQDINLNQEYYALTNITDMLGLASKPQVSAAGGDIASLVTPYGTTSFTSGGGGASGNTRYAEISYPDGSRERVEYNQSQNIGLPGSDPVASVPTGMGTFNQFLYGRNTFYWSRTACASSYGDYSKAKIYHWLHTEDIAKSSGILESTKEPLEGRVWYNYAGQNTGFGVVGINNNATKIGRVLDDGQTQLQTQGYNSFGLLTNTVDPLGRTFSMLYATNSIDLLEARQTRGTNNELLFHATYNSQHRPLTVVDAAGQTNSFSYNARGQLLTSTNPKSESVTNTYDTNGYLMAVDGPLPGTNDTVTFTYDSFGRVHTVTGLSLYTLTFDYDAMDRITKITHPDNTFEEFIYDRLDLATFRDRATRETTFEHDSMRQVRKRTDPLNRITRFDWCRCGQLGSLTDPMGRTTSWSTDVQGRRTAKHYADGSEISYLYENTTSRPRFVIDEKQQITAFVWNRDGTLRSIAYDNAQIPTPGVSFLYDPDYERVLSMTDGTGTTRYSYSPITGTPILGAGALASIDGPLTNDTVTYGYDELGRVTHRAIGGVDSAVGFDEVGRVTGVSNVLGAFSYGYDGPSGRLISKSFPNDLVSERSYTNTLQDLLLQRITHKRGATPISEFLYSHDVSRSRINVWSQQAGLQSPDVFSLDYDSVNQLLSANVTNAGNLVNSFSYSYDPAANRLTEQIGPSNSSATYNGLNQIRTTTAPEITSSNEWDALDRLVAVNVGTERSEFTYDGASRMTSIRKLINRSEVSIRRFVWCGDEICEERDSAGVVTKRFFGQGMKVESGPSAGAYFYTRDHLGSIRELTDSSGNVRARYSYDPFGRQTKLFGDIDSDFGFAGMFFSTEANLALTHYRAYDPELGRWLSRDPLRDAEVAQGPNLYAYVANNPISRIDPEGLCWGTSLCACFRSPAAAAACINAGIITVQQALDRGIQVVQNGVSRCAQSISTIGPRIASLEIRYEQLRPVLRFDWDRQARSLRELPAGGWLLPLWTNDMIELEQEFASIVELLQTELGIGAEEAWLLLATRLGWNPNTWTTWKPFGTW
jgi:RHS repeat-associated protein